MKRIQILTTIFIVAIIGSALAQDDYDLTARKVEPARTRLIPYNNMAGAIADKPSSSRFFATLEESIRKDEGTKASFTTHFALPVSWLNRQVILRVGYASAAYTVHINGREMGFAPTGVMGAEFNITKATKEGRNEVVITLDRSLLANKIYEPKELLIEDIEIFSQPTLRLRDIAVNVTLNEQGDGIAEFALPVKCDALNRKEARFHYALKLNDSTLVAEGYREIALDMRREDTLRFACVVPAKMLWSVNKPTMLRLEIENRIDNRIAECISRPIALRQVRLQKRRLYINNEPVSPNLAEWTAIKSLEEARQLGYNGIIITLDRNAEKILAECESQGLYAVVRTPIDTTLLGDDIRRDGNPSNDPAWRGEYLWRNIHALHSTKSNAAVIGYAIAKGNTSGISIYDTYVEMKSLAPNMLVIYEGAKGEWATDK